MSSDLIENKYKKWYYAIIANARSCPPVGYKEVHHIIPRSLGGKNTPDNLVALSARQHYICHLLLIKITTGIDKSKMAYALHRIVHGNTKGLVKTSRIYSLLKTEFSKANSEFNLGKNNFFYGKHYTGDTNHFYGRHHTDETKAKISNSRKGKGRQIGEQNPMYGKVGELSPFYGIPRTEETKMKIKQTKAKNPQCGASHPRSIPVEINGIVYESKNIARKVTGLSEYFINKLASNSK